MSEHYLLLKWGTLKGWNIPDDLIPILERYFDDGVPMSRMADRPDDSRKKILCELIDAFEGPIGNDWNGESYTKDEAKKYVMEYDR